MSSYYRTVAIDLKGHGASDKPQVRYTVRGFTEEVNQLVERIIPKDKFVLCGHSFGGYIGLTYATDPAYSKRLKGLILCNTLYTGKGNLAMKSLLDSLKTGAFGSRKAFSEIFMKLGYNIKFANEHKDIIKASVEEVMKCPDHVALSWMGSIIEEYDTTDKLGKINVPVLIITSDNDGEQDPKQSYYMREHIKGSQLVEFKPKIGHHPMIEDPDQFNKTVKAFMDKLK